MARRALNDDEFKEKNTDIIGRNPNKLNKVANGNNAQYMEHELAIIEYASNPDNQPDFSDLDSIKLICTYYLNKCAEDDIKPNVVGLALVLGVTRNRLMNIMNGSVPRVSPDVRELLTRCCTLMEYQLNMSIQNSNGHPLGNMFLLKNHFNYQDKNELFVTQKESAVVELTNDELKEQYAQNIVDIDDDM